MIRHLCSLFYDKMEQDAQTNWWLPAINCVLTQLRIAAAAVCASHVGRTLVCCVVWRIR